MNRYAIFLRAVNVGGTKLPMAEFRALLDGLGYKNITTYVQSGNAVISALDSPEAIASAISESIEKTFGYKVAMVVLSRDELAEIIAGNPYIDRSNVDPKSLHATLLATHPDPTSVAGLDQKLGGRDEWLLINQTVYLHCPEGYGRTKLTNALFERKWNVVATTRNWKTMMTMLELVRN